VVNINDMDNTLAEFDGQYRKQKAKFDQMQAQLVQLRDELTTNRCDVVVAVVFSPGHS